MHQRNIILLTADTSSIIMAAYMDLDFSVNCSLCKDRRISPR